MRTKRHIQSKSHCQEKETWLPEQNSDEEGTEAVDEEGEEGTVEFESLRDWFEERQHEIGQRAMSRVRIAIQQSCYRKEFGARRDVSHGSLELPTVYILYIACISRDTNTCITNLESMSKVNNLSVCSSSTCREGTLCNELRLCMLF
jgi:hypothetical protein